jgi:hypothetical protein
MASASVETIRPFGTGIPDFFKYAFTVVFSSATSTAIADVWLVIEACTRF